MSTIHDVPKFKHNCDSCVFLIKVWAKKGKAEYDAYICKNGDIHEIVMRYGDEPDQYKTPYWSLEGLDEAFKHYGIHEQDIELIFDEIEAYKWNEDVKRNPYAIRDDLVIHISMSRWVRQVLRQTRARRKENNG